MKKKIYMKHILSMLLALCMVITAVFGNLGGAGLMQADAAESGSDLTTITDEPDYDSTVQSLHKVTLTDFGLENKTYTGHVYYTETGPETLLDTMMEMTLTVTGSSDEEEETYIQYAVPEGKSWYGIRMKVYSEQITVSHIESYFTGFDIPVSAIEGATSFFNTPFRMGISIEQVDLDSDGANNDVRLGFWLEGQLYHYAYAKNHADNFGTGMTLIPNVNSSGKRTVTVYNPTVESLRKVTLTDFGRASGTHTGHMYYTSTGPETLLNTMMEMILTVIGSSDDSEETYIQYAVPEDLGWRGVRMKVFSDKITVSHIDSYFTGFDIPVSAIKGATSFFKTPFKMGISIEQVDSDSDGANNDVRLGFWMDGLLYRYVYAKDHADDIGTGLSLIPNVNNKSKRTVTIYNPVELSSDFETIGLADVTTAPVTAGVYQSKNKWNPASINERKDGDLNGKIFTTNIRFTEEFSQLFYGCTTDSVWTAIRIGGAESDPSKFSVQSFFKSATGEQSDTAIKYIAANAVGFDLFNNTFELGISTRNVDCDGDDVFDDVELGLWFEGKLYNNAYFYLPNVAGLIKPNLDVYTWRTDKSTTNEGQIILGDYTQQTPTEVVYCADEYVYVATGDTVTVNGESKGSSWNTDISGEYQLTYTEKNSTFKENILIYKTNDVTANGKVDVADIVALVKLSQEMRTNTTVAGKKAVNYVDATSFNGDTALVNMRADYLKSDNVIQAKKMSDTILGETGSKGSTGMTYITNLDTTEEGTSVISISDIANAEDRTYTTDVEALDGTGLDFILDFDTDRDIKVLQITDTQIIDSAQCRTDDRLSQASKELCATDQMDTLLFDELDQLIAAQQPDLILLTGDIVYGEFDDKGTSFNKIIEEMDSYKIPWAPVFGNHDNESAIGVIEQCRRFVEESDYCLFNRRNEIGGNGNYAIGVAVRGELRRTIFMLDSNGCTNLANVPAVDQAAMTTTYMFHDTQIAWYQTVAARVNQFAQQQIPSLMCFHVPPMETSRALMDKGHQGTADISSKVFAMYDLGMDASKEDFGFKQGSNTAGNGLQHFILPYLQAAGTDGVFFGHQHTISLSVQWEGIRWTFGLKTGQYDSHPALRGGTMITLTGSDFAVKHVLFDENVN